MGVCVVALDWLVSAWYVFQAWCIGGGCFDACVVPVWWEECVVQVLLGATGGRVPVRGRLVQGGRVEIYCDIGYILGSAGCGWC